MTAYIQAGQAVLQEKLDEVKAVMLNGEEMKSRCCDDEMMQLTNKLLHLHRQTCSTVAKSNALQVVIIYTALVFQSLPFCSPFLWLSGLDH